MSERQRECKSRRQLKKQGYCLRKSRVRYTHSNNLGGYMIIDPYTNTVVAGVRFELDLDEVEQFVES